MSDRKKQVRVFRSEFQRETELDPRRHWWAVLNASNQVLLWHGPKKDGMTWDDLLAINPGMDRGAILYGCAPLDEVVEYLDDVYPGWRKSNPAHYLQEDEALPMETFSIPTGWLSEVSFPEGPQQIVLALRDHETAFTVPWALLVDESGQLYIDGEFHVTMRAVGTCAMQIKRVGNSIYVNRDTAGQVHRQAFLVVRNPEHERRFIPANLV
jgi:hypothetical protein